MSALDDFIAVDPSSRDFVDPHGDTRWSEYDCRMRTETILDGLYPRDPDQRVISRLIDVYQMQRTLASYPDPDMVLPGYTVSLADKQLMSAFAATSVLCGALKAVMWGRAQLVNAAIDYEQLRAWLASLPPVEPNVTDPWADMRAMIVSMMASATQQTLDTVAERDDWRLNH